MELYYCVVKTKVLISFTFTAKLISAFVFACAKCWFSYGVAQMFLLIKLPYFLSMLEFVYLDHCLTIHTEASPTKLVFINQGHFSYAINIFIYFCQDLIVYQIFSNHKFIWHQRTTQAHSTVPTCAHYNLHSFLHQNKRMKLAVTNIKVSS